MKTDRTPKRLAMILAPIGALALSLAVWGSSASSTTPPYTITKQDMSGNQRTVEVQVDSGKDLKSVFDDVTGKLKEDAGYVIRINCSTGGTKNTDNRLANGTYAKGAMGAATTGLKRGSKQFETVTDTTCT